jgi:uroporphyrinogen-III decarboxylase
MAKKDMEHINRDETAVVLYTHVGYFQQLMAFMGFSEGLCAMYEEPEEVMALFDYMCEFYTEVTKKCLEYYKPDLVELTDDTATARNPFISVDMFRELVKPYHKAQMQPVVDAGLPMFMHNCGRCEDFIEDWFDCGVTAWNPAQVMNDLDGIKKKYGNRLGLCGCWDSSGPVGWPSATEELIRQAVRDTIDRFAPGGGFCFWGSVYGPVGDKATGDRKRWLTEEYESYGRTFYNK